MQSRLDQFQKHTFYHNSLLSPYFKISSVYALAQQISTECPLNAWHRSRHLRVQEVNKTDQVSALMALSGGEAIDKLI